MYKRQILFTFYSRNIYTEEESVPIVFDNTSKIVNVDGYTFNLGLWDTSGVEDLERRRPLDYPQTDIFFLCYYTHLPNSITNAYNVWFPEIKFHCPEALIVVLGMIGPERKISREEGEQLKIKTYAARFLECNLQVQEDVDNVFYEAIRALVFPKPKQSKNLFKKFFRISDKVFFWCKSR